MKIFHYLIIASLLFLLSGCAARPIPKSFNKSVEPTWISIPVRDDVKFEHAWNMTMKILSKDFDLEYVLKDDAYIRTAWLNSWSGKWQDNYRVKVTARFSEDRTVLELKPEALAMISPNVWIMGVDTRLVSTIKTDVMGTLGRTTR